MNIRFNVNTPYKPNIIKRKETQNQKEVSNVSAKEVSNEKGKKYKIGISIAAIVVLAAGLFTLFKKPNKIQHNNINQCVIPIDKLEFLDITGIKNIIRHSKDGNVNPETILKQLRKTKNILFLAEKPFEIGQNKQITAGRKFTFIFKSSNGKRYHMIFEVHDFIKDGKRTWIMRIYDNDKIKDSRSYISRIGNFIENAYKELFAHIPCGEYGENFVLGEKACA